MIKKLANTLSLVFHPLFMPSYGIILLFNFGNYFTYLPPRYKWYVYAVVWVFTLAFPLLSLFLMKKMRRISSYNMPHHRERVVPMIMVLFSYVAAIVLLYRLRVPSLVLQYFIGMTVVLAILTVVSYWWKMSAHMAGIGGFIAASILLGVFLQINNSFLVGIFFLVAGYLGWARLELKAHSTLQVLLGFCTGFTAISLIASGIFT